MDNQNDISCAFAQARDTLIEVMRNPEHPAHKLLMRGEIAKAAAICAQLCAEKINEGE